MSRYVLDFHEIDRTQVATVGGKGAHLGELSRIEGVHVPAWLLRHDDAFRRAWRRRQSIDELLDPLSRLEPEDRDAIDALTTEIRRVIEGTPIPSDVAAAIIGRAHRARRGSGLRGPLECDRRGPADRLLRGPARHVPEHRRGRRRSSARQPVLGVALHGARCHATASGTAIDHARSRWPWSSSGWCSPT